MQGDTKYSSTSAKKDPDVLEDRDRAMSNVHSHTDFKALHGKFLRNLLDHSASLHPRVKKKIHVCMLFQLQHWHGESHDTDSSLTDRILQGQGCAKEAGIRTQNTL